MPATDRGKATWVNVSSTSATPSATVVVSGDNDEIGLRKIEEKDKQFLVEKIIAKIENHTL